MVLGRVFGWEPESDNGRPYAEGGADPAAVNPALPDHAVGEAPQVQLTDAGVNYTRTAEAFSTSPWGLNMMPVPAPITPRRPMSVLTRTRPGLTLSL